VDGEGGGVPGIRAQRVHPDPDDVAIGDEQVACLSVAAGERERDVVGAVDALARRRARTTEDVRGDAVANRSL
jgi:hypothetical protein